MDDPRFEVAAMDELYLHHSDHLNYVISTRLLNDGNYNHWKRSCEVSLLVKNKLGFVTDTCHRPTSGSAMSQWDRCNHMVILWLLHSVNKDIAETVLYCSTAKQIWDELGARFSKSSRTRIFRVKKESAFVSQENLSITSYFTKRKKLWYEYKLLVEHRVCICGFNSAILKLLEEQQVMQFLMGLNDTYNVVRGNILMNHPHPSLDEVYKFLLQEQEQ